MGKLVLTGRARLNKGDCVLAVTLFLAALFLTTLSTVKEIPMGDSNAVLGELTVDKPVYQVLPISGETVDRIDLIFGTYSRSNTSKLKLYLKGNSGEVYAEACIPCEDLIDNVTYSWEFEPVSFPESEVISIGVFPTGEAGNSVTLYYDSHQLGEILVGDAMYQGRLSGSIYGPEIQTIFSYSLEPLRAVLLLALIYTCLWCIVQKKGMTSAVRCMAVITPCVLILFFAMPPIITYDSAHYLNYLPILNGEVGFEEWDVVRGPVFPVMLNLACKFFGENPAGLLTFEFLFFEATLFCILIAVQKFSARDAGSFHALVVIALVFLFNPIFQGGFHAVLTEFPAAFFTMLSCLVAWKWTQREGNLDKIDAAFSAYFILCSVLVWQLKQPYMGCTLYPLIAVILHMIIVRRPWGKWRVALRAAIPIVCLSAMLLSASVWTGFVASAGPVDTTRTSAGIAANVILWNLPLEDAGIYSDEDIGQTFELSVPQAELLEESLPDEVYRVFRLKTIRGGLQSQIVLVPDDQDGGILSSIRIFFRCLGQFPAETVENYFWKYLKICNIVTQSSEIANQPSIHIQPGHGDEIPAIYYRSAYGLSNVFYLSETLQPVASPFYCQYIPSILLRSFLLLNAVLYADSLFKMLMCLAPFIWGCLLITMIRCRKDRHKIDCVFIHFLLWTYSFCNLTFNVLFGGPIDRYLFTSFFVAFVSVVLFLTRRLIPNH